MISWRRTRIVAKSDVSLILASRTEAQQSAISASTTPGTRYRGFQRHIITSTMSIRGIKRESLLPMVAKAVK